MLNDAAHLNVKSALYKWEDYYYLYVDVNDLENAEAKNIVALCSEYLPASQMTIHRLEEYAETIIPENCFETISYHFD